MYGDYMNGFNGNMYGNTIGTYGAPQMAQRAPQMMQNRPSTGGINLVQGLTGAKAHIVNPGETVFLMDSENSVFYIKSADNSGMPLPLRVFDYTERTQEKINQESAGVQLPDLKNEFVTREEYNNLLEALKKRTQKKKPVPKLDIEEEYEDAESLI